MIRPYQYESIHGWFDWPEVYSKWVIDAPPNALIVEVGVWLGRSLCYLAEMCQNLQRTDIRLIGIDTWDGCEKCQWEMIQALELNSEGLFSLTRDNLSFDNVSLIRGDADEVAERHDIRPDYCFIDSDHKYSAVNEQSIPGSLEPRFSWLDTIS